MRTTSLGFDMAIDVESGTEEQPEAWYRLAFHVGTMGEDLLRIVER